MPLLVRAFLVLAGAQAPPDSCSRTWAAVAVDSGWQAYRAGALVVAGRLFMVADSLCPRLAAAETGLAFVALRLDRPAEAERRLRRALARDSSDADAWYGLGLALERREDRASAVRSFRRALHVSPNYRDAVDQLLGLGVDSGLPRPPVVLPATPEVPARTVAERFEVVGPAGWRPFYVKGINLGAALPGRFPSEFPLDDSTYTRWLGLMAAANANVVRVYTLLPPAFYRALRAWNAAHPEHPLWLVHGVWAELPPRDDYDAPGWLHEFRAEMRRVVDAVHGRALVAARRGHAWGRYEADVSDHVLALVLGREWEPFSIAAYDRRASGRHRYAGRFLAVDSGSAADVWLAEQCDYLLRYEWDTYRAQRPIAYTNWPTLDPLHHVTEATAVEEQALRRRFGFPLNPRLKEYDNDAQSLDAMLVRTTPADVAGYFAVYHAYPYYPDFMNLDSAYGAAAASEGPSHYFGYLLDLKRHHAGRPLLIAEYGVPSSRGVSHLQADGANHGGHDEWVMAALDAKLTREIHDAGLAGGIVFSWLDEWFKHTWVTIDLEAPADRARLWHNAMDAEQNYGLLGEYAGGANTTPEPGGDASLWRALPQLERGAGVTVRAGADPAYFYLALAAGTALISSRFVIGIDTYGRDLGERALPGISAANAGGTGFEFAVVLADTGDAQVLVAPWYNPYLAPRAGSGPTALDRFYHFGATVEARHADGGWDSLFVATNRWRIGRDGRTYAARGVNRGRLRYGRAAETSLADWYCDAAAGLIEVRLPWALLNVTDPSSRRVLRRIGPGETFATVVTDGFRLAVAALDRGHGTMRAWVPAGPAYAWPTWEEPVWHEHLKPAYDSLRSVWSAW